MILMSDTLGLLKRGVSSSEATRAALAPRYGLSHDQEAWARFVNNHAWALVRLQSAGKIRKVATGVYALTEAQPALPQPRPTEPIRDGEPLPEWARQQVSRANSRNNAKCWSEAPPLFTGEGIRQLWRECRGHCAMTGLPFDDKEVGRVRRVGLSRPPSTAWIRKSPIRSRTAASYCRASTSR
jgi:hypothetical protein